MSDFDEALDNVIVLTDSDGREVQLEFLDLIPYRGKEYVVDYLIPGTYKYEGKR